MKTLLFAIPIIMCWISSAQNLGIELVASSVNTPTTITNAGDTRLFVTEKSGKIHILSDDGSVEPTPFLDISSKVSNGSEQGLLGLAFHPNYASNGFFYVSYTNTNGDSVIARYSRATVDTANTSSEVILLTVSQFASNHNGGSIAFGPDDKLYVGIGDGGGGGDPRENGQDTSNKLGAILRLDVDIASPYFPSDNPFVGIAGDDAIWMYGLRNPWKFSFDNDDIWIADVGDNGNGDEEVNRVVGNIAATNFGWSCYEGNDPQTPSRCSSIAGLIFPVATYDRVSSPSRRCSITGGIVYRGSKYPSMQGKYIFGDACSDELLMIDPSTDVSTIVSVRNIFTASGSSFFNGPLSFGTDADGELYVGAADRIYKVIDKDQALSNDEFIKRVERGVYPNPSTETFTLDIDNGGIKELQIYDLKGALVKISSVDENTLGVFDVSKLFKGTYIIRVISNLGRSEEFKLVID